MKKTIVMLATSFVLLHAMVMAATTGKISGVVVDAKTGQPLIGANVLIEGTQLGGISDAKGEFFIINIPPGEYSLKTSYMGYETQAATGVRVNIERTTNMDVRLTPTVLSGKEVVVVAQRERIQRDVSYSQKAITAEEIIAAPTGQDLRETIAMGVGIMRDVYGHISIRGGEMDEVGFFVDDFSMNDRRMGSPIIQIPKAAVKEIQVLTGGFNAEYGEARSGMINIVTKEGSAAYHGSIDYRMSPAALKHFGPNVYDANAPENWWEVGRFLSMGPSEDRDGDGTPDFEGWTSFMKRNPKGITPAGSFGGPIRTAEEGLAVWEFQHRPLEYGNKPDHYIESAFGGAVPFTKGKLTFFYNGYYDRSMWPFRLSTYRPAFTDQTQTLKLKYPITKNISLRYTGNYGEIHSLTYQPGVNQFINPHYWDNVTDASYGVFNGHLYNADSRVGQATIWRTMHGMDLTHTLNKNSFYEARFQYERTRYREHPGPGRSGAIVATIGEVKLDETPIGFAADKWKDVQNYHRLSEDKGQRDYSWYETFQMRGDYTNQITGSHQIKAGFKGILDKMHLHYGIDMWDQAMKNRFSQWTSRDVNYAELSAYVQDKIEFEGMVMNAGLRLDAFDPNSYTFIDPWSRYYGNKVNYDSLLFAPHADANMKLALSPRVGVSHPISDNSKLFFNYGYFYQRGSVESLYKDLQQRTSRLNQMGNPELNYLKTISYELGIEQSLFNLFSYRLAGYYKDVSNQVSSVTFTGIKSDISYTRTMNNGYKDQKGFELEVNMLRVGYFSGWMNYNYMISSSGWYGWKTIYQDPLKKNVLQSSNQSKPKPQPWLRANLVFRTPEWKEAGVLKNVLSNLMISTYVQWRSGQWLTYHSDAYQGVEENNIHWLPWYNIDLNLSKGFQILGMRPYLYCEVHNLLNKRFLTSDFGLWRAETTYLETIAKVGLKPGEYDNPEVQKIMDKEWSALLWGTTRDIWLGVRIEF